MPGDLQRVNANYFKEHNLSLTLDPVFLDVPCRQYRRDAVPCWRKMAAGAGTMLKSRLAQQQQLVLLRSGGAIGL